MKKSYLSLSALALAFCAGVGAQVAHDFQVFGVVSPTPCQLTVSNALLQAPVFYRNSSIGMFPNNVEHTVDVALTLGLTCAKDQTVRLKLSGSDYGTGFIGSTSSFFNGGTLAAAKGSMTNAFPLIADGASEPAAFVHLVGSSTEGKAFRNYSAANDSLYNEFTGDVILTNFANVYDAIRNDGRMLQFDYIQTEGFSLDVKAIWSLYRERIPESQPVNLTGSVSFEIQYL